MDRNNKRNKSTVDPTKLVHLIIQIEQRGEESPYLDGLRDALKILYGCEDLSSFSQSTTVTDDDLLNIDLLSKRMQK